MKHFRTKPTSKAQRIAQRRNFALYRLNGMMGNLGGIYYEYRDNPEICKTLSIAMDAVYETLQQIREERNA